MSRKNWGQRIGRIVLTAVNIMFIVVGVGVLIAALVFYDKINDIRSQADVLEDLSLRLIVTVVLFTSGGTVVTAIMGLVAVIKKVKKLLMLYILFAFIIFAVQLALGILMLNLKAENARNSFREDSQAGFERRERFQNYMRCCGWTYLTEEFYPERVACIARHPSYTDTCLSKVQEFMDQVITPTAIAVIVASLLLLVGLVASLMVIAFNRTAKEDFFENAFTA